MSEPLSSRQTRRILPFLVALASSSTAPQLPAQGTTTRVSVGSNGAQGNMGARDSAISADGRWVAFSGDASTLVPGDTNNARDVFVRDLAAGTTTRVSVDSSGGQSNGDSLAGCLSADGRFVAFRSFASNLVPGDTNNAQDVFVHDNLTGRTSIIVADTNTSIYDYSVGPSISADGRIVAFASEASTLVPGDTNGTYDVFVHDRATGQTTLVSVDSNGVQGDGPSRFPVVSADGRLVAFVSGATNLVPGDTNATLDVFVFDRETRQTTRVSVDSNGVQGNGQCGYPCFSGDGRFVAFDSFASNLFPGDTNGRPDVFVRDRLTGTTSLVSVDSNGAQGNTDSFLPSLSADGRFVAFSSLASNLVPGDTNTADDIFVHDRESGRTTRVSVASDGTQGDYDSIFPAISADGRYVVFLSGADDLVPGDTNLVNDIFLRDRGAPEPRPFCFGSGSSGSCPCGNRGQPGRGCENSAGTGGAFLSAAGTSSLAGDTIVLTSSGELPTATSVMLQGDADVAATIFGDGLRCVGGHLERLFVHSAAGGVFVAPRPGDPAVSTRSATLGDPIPIGATRHYQAYYRDGDPSFCPFPTGDSWNISSGLSIVWSP